MSVLSETTDPMHTTAALKDALNLSQTEADVPLATEYIGALEGNNLSIRSYKTGGGFVEMLKQAAIGMRVNDGTNNVVRAYVDDDSPFGRGDFVIGNLTSTTAGSGMIWDQSAGLLRILGNAEFMGKVNTGTNTLTGSGWQNMTAGGTIGIICGYTVTTGGIITVTGNEFGAFYFCSTGVAGGKAVRRYSLYPLFGGTLLRINNVVTAFTDQDFLQYDTTNGVYTSISIL